MNILALGAHPDDTEIGCGGTLLKYTRAGHGVYLMVLTEGAQGGSAKVRRDEQLASCRILGVKEVFWGGYPDTEVPVTRQAIQQIEDIVKKVDPAFIFVNYFDDTHQDHRHLATCTVTATRYTRNVLFYETPTTQNFSPTVYVDIDGLLEDKVHMRRRSRRPTSKGSASWKSRAPQRTSAVSKDESDLLRHSSRSGSSST